MESRVDKYNNNVMSRTEKNHHLYEEISDADISSFDVNSNTIVLGNNQEVIDVAKLRDMLDKQYREEPKRNKIAKFQENIIDNPKLDETGEYDIIEFLNKAKENKEEDYEIERLKKLRNTQFDILNSLDLPKLHDDDEEVESKVASSSEADKLMELINTINITEATNKNKEIDPLDLLSDLKGSDETKVFGADELQEIEEKSQEVIPLPETIQNQNEEKNSAVSEIDKSFYTASTNLTKSDFDDFNDLKDDVETSKIIVKILIIVVLLAFIFGIFFILNKVLEWGII